MSGLLARFPKNPNGWINEFFALAFDLVGRDAGRISLDQLLSVISVRADFFVRYFDAIGDADTQYLLIEEYDLGAWVVDVMNDAYLLYRIRPQSIGEYMVFAREVKIQEKIASVSGLSKKLSARAKFTYNLTGHMVTYIEETQTMISEARPVYQMTRAKLDERYGEFDGLCKYLLLTRQEERSVYLVGDKLDRALEAEKQRHALLGKNFGAQYA